MDVLSSTRVLYEIGVQHLGIGRTCTAHINLHKQFHNLGGEICVRASCFVWVAVGLPPPM